jgi:hypothetical protein
MPRGWLLVVAGALTHVGLQSTVPTVMKDLHPSRLGNESEGDPFGWHGSARFYAQECRVLVRLVSVNEILQSVMAWNAFS